MVISGVLFSLLYIYTDLLGKTPLFCNHLLKILCRFNLKPNVKLDPAKFQLGYIYRRLALLLDSCRYIVALPERDGAFLALRSEQSGAAVAGRRGVAGYAVYGGDLPVGGDCDLKSGFKEARFLQRERCPCRGPDPLQECLRG